MAKDFLKAGIYVALSLIRADILECDSVLPFFFKLSRD